MLELIDKEGSVPPDWMASTPLEYPKTLDISWPKDPSKPWNNQRNVGQYLWDIIYPNQNRWRSGIRFISHIAERDPDHPRAVPTLGQMYFNLLQDYPRAAYWWHKAGVKQGSPQGVGLAECYWRLGNKKMALDMISGRKFRLTTIKLLGDMGQTDRAVKLAEIYVKQSKQPHWALLAAGDACRSAKRYKEAIRYYQRVAETKMSNEHYDKRIQARAVQSIDAIKQFELLDITKVKDGTYTAESMGYEGPVAVEVNVKSGRIEDVKVTRHKEKQFYAALRDIPAQIVSKQSVKDVDATSRATITAEAIISATAKALAD